MVLSEIEDMLIQVTGRNDLDTAANKWRLHFFINAGQRMLDRSDSVRGLNEKFFVDVLQAQQYVEMVNLRALLDGYVMTADGTNLPLIPYKTHRALREAHPDLSEEDQGQPTHYAFNPTSETEPSITPNTESVTNGTFAADSNWDKGAAWTIAGGVAVHDGPGTSMDQLAAAQAIPLVVGQAYRVKYDITAHTVGSIKLILGTAVTKLRNNVGHFTEDIVCRGGTGIHIRVLSEDPSETVTLTIDNVSVINIHHAVLTTVPDYVTPGFKTTRHVASIAIAPIPDQTYTLEFHGKFYTIPLLTAGDRSWWSENEPDLLIYAAAFKLESFYRNTEGMRDWKLAMDESLSPLHRDRVEHDLVYLADQAKDLVMEG